MVSRRTVLSATGGIVALGVIGYGGSLGLCARRDVASLRLDRLDIALADIREAVRIGQAYRERTDFASLIEGVHTKPRLTRALAIECPDTRRREVRLQVREDFAAGDSLVIERWVMSRTECLISGLRSA